jgi:hypothetical protein
MYNRSSSYEHGLYALAVPVAVFAFILWSIADPSSRSTVPDEKYTIVVERTDDGLAFTCQDGCAWKETTWECSDPENCRAKVDFNGVGPASDSQ